MKHKDTRFKKKTIISYFPPDQAVMCVLTSYKLNPLFKIVLKNKTQLSLLRTLKCLLRSLFNCLGPPLRPVLRSEGPPDLVGRPGAHPVLFGPAGVHLALGAKAGVAIGWLLRHHLGYQVADGAAHVWRAGEGGGGGRVRGAGGG